MSILGLVILFLILAIISGFLGFTDVKFISIEIARVLFVIFLVLFIASLVFHLIR